MSLSIATAGHTHRKYGLFIPPKPTECNLNSGTQLISENVFCLLWLKGHCALLEEINLKVMVILFSKYGEILHCRSQLTAGFYHNHHIPDKLLEHNYSPRKTKILLVFQKIVLNLICIFNM